MAKKKITLGIVLCLMLGTMVVATGPVEASEPNTTSSLSGQWPSFGLDEQNTGNSPYYGPTGEVEKLWAADIYGESGGFDWQSPVIGDDGTIYIGTSGGAFGYLYEVNPDDGDYDVFFDDDTKIIATPAIDEEGSLYFPTGGDYNVWGVDSEGEEKWHISGRTGMFKQSSPNIFEGTVYISVAYESEFHALNVDDGNLEWSDPYPIQRALSTPAISHCGDYVYIGGRDGLHAVERDTGKGEWIYPTGDSVISSPAIGDDGTIYVGSTDNNLHAVNPDTGEEKWIYPTGGDVISSPAIGDDGTIYVGSKDNYLHAVNPDTGEEKWTYPTGGDVISSPAIGGDGTIYVGSNDGNLYAVNPDTGEEEWIFDEPGGPIKSSPAIDEDGKIYVASEDGNLYAIGDYTLTVSSTFGGSTDPPEGTHDYPPNENVDLSAYPSWGHEFHSWSVNGQMYYTPYITITMDEDKNAYAMFVPENGGPTSLDSGYGQYLEEGDAAEDLVVAFNDAGLPLSEESDEEGIVVLAQVDNDLWNVLVNGEEKYLIVETDQELKIFSYECERNS